MAVAPLLESLLARTAVFLAARRRVPVATYRLQFQAGFTFRDACAIVPYLQALGISDCYASPYLQARPGSQHGYDITNHSLLNPEIGSEEDYNAWVEALHQHGMGQVADIVPNHMGVVGNVNPWWNDILENGPCSPYAGFFDIDWHSSLRINLHEQILLPILGDPYGKALESGQLQLQSKAGFFTIHYFDHHFPVSPCAYNQILSHRLAELEPTLVKADALVEYKSILTAISHLPPRTCRDPDRISERLREKEVIKRRLAALIDQTVELRAFLDQNIRIFNGKANEPHSFDLLDDLLNQQTYRLSYWRVAADEINYRRFFDINELAALSMEKPEVFEAAHILILRLLREGKITGIRIDHPDGLYDPREYLRRLQNRYALECARTVFSTDPIYQGMVWEEVQEPLRAAIDAEAVAVNSPFHRPLYVLVEKILGKAEPIPEDWPVDGTTGYEFLNVLNGIFVDVDSAPDFNRIYSRWASRIDSFEEIAYRNKFLILQVALSSELHVLAHQLDRLSEQNRWSRDFTLNSLRHALRDVIACFPVYRSYIADDHIHPRDRYYVETAVARAKRKNPAISAMLFDFVRDMLLLRYSEAAGAQDREDLRRFAGKFQQVTAPVMAKGLEDTSFYVYNRLLSLNEVGGDPGEFGVSLTAFHRHNQERQQRWPQALSTTATHDTKRGEDVRARMNVLSELPQEWQKCLSRWYRRNRRYHERLEDLEAPDRNDEYLFYQTLIGAWPVEPYTSSEYAEFVRRILAYMEKATHEAKVHTSWVNPNPAYDTAVHNFVTRVLDEHGNAPFLQSFRPFKRRISHYGMFNALAQALLKITAPGVPDFYQGTELWDFSLVDPDNRRPVDYVRRQQMLQALQGQIATAGARLPQLAEELVTNKEDGRIKLYVIYLTLQQRHAHPELFSQGSYSAADSQGKWRDHMCAFVRRWEKNCAIVCVPRHITQLIPQNNQMPLGREVWDDTLLLVPGVAPGTQLRNLFTGETYATTSQHGQMAISLAEVFAHFPVALLFTV